MICKVSLKNVIGAAFAVLTVLLLMGLCSQEVFAQGRVTVKYDPGVDSGETTYKLYRVGKFGPNGTFAFIEPFADNISEVPNYKKTDPDWQEKWMTSANVVAEYIKEAEVDPIETKTVSVADSKAGFSFSSTLNNGFYLVTGTSIKETDGSGNVTYHWPRPMYIMVLNDDPEYGLKPAQGKATILKVLKQWENDEDVKDLSRPDKIILHRSYDGVDKGDIELPHDGNWYYIWETEIGEDDPEKWVVTEDIEDEKIKKNYTVLDTDKFDDKTGEWLKTITNTFDRKKLKITKNLPDYISHDDGSTQPFVFEVWGYAGKELEFHKHATILFGAESGESEFTYVENIARTVDRVVVKEVSFGNYKPEGDAEKEAQLDVDDEGNRIFSVSFTNTINTDQTYDTGVINKYSITGDSEFKFNKKIGK